MVARAGRPVVVGVDGSDSAVRAVRWAAAEAGRRQVRLRLVTAFEQMRGGVPERQFGDVLLDRARLWLAEAVQVAAREAPAVDLEHEMVAGHPLSVLAAEARRAALVVVGASGCGPVEGMRAGSVAVGLAVQAPGTVVVVRGADLTMAETRLPVVVGVDGSAVDGQDGADAAIAFAFEAAEARRVSVVGVHTWSDLQVDPEIAPQLDWDVIDAGARRRLSARLDPWTRTYPDLGVESVIDRDHPARALLRQAAQAQLVVVGPGGRGAFAGLLLGSVCHTVLHRSPCPVAVVRPDAHGSP